MPAASDKEIILQRAKRQDDEFAHIMTELTRHVGSDPVAGMVAALFATAAAFTAQGEELELYKKKGWLSSKREWVDAATKLRGLATQLENYGARTAWQPAGPTDTPGALVPGEGDVTASPALMPDEPAAAGHYAAGTEVPPEVEAIRTYLAGGDGDPLDAPPPAGDPWASNAERSAALLVPVPTELAADPGAPGVADFLASLMIPTDPALLFRAPPPVADPPPPGEPAASPASVDDLANPFTAPKGPGRVVSRLTFADVARLAAEDGDASPESSYSQITTISNCGMKYQLGRLSRHKLAGAERPNWGGVGGTALHAAITAYEDWFTAEPGPAPDVLLPSADEMAQMWAGAFQTAIMTTLAEAGPYDSLQSWHASNRGREGYDWWRVEGLAMLNRYADSHGPTWSQRWALQAQEFEYRMDVDGVVSHGYIDQVWTNGEPGAAGELLIEDLKSGSRLPSDALQLGEYAWALVKVKGVDPARIAEVAYWNARTGQRTVYPDIFAAVTWDDLVFYHHAATNQKRTNAIAAREYGRTLWLPNVSSLCGGCGVRDLCPTQR